MKTIKNLLSAHEGLLFHARELVELAEIEKDGATLDLLWRRLAIHKKIFGC